MVPKELDRRCRAQRALVLLASQPLGSFKTTYFRQLCLQGVRNRVRKFQPVRSPWSRGARAEQRNAGSLPARLVHSVLWHSSARCCRSLVYQNSPKPDPRIRLSQRTLWQFSGFCGPGLSPWQRVAHLALRREACERHRLFQCHLRNWLDPQSRSPGRLRSPGRAVEADNRSVENDKRQRPCATGPREQ